MYKPFFLPLYRSKSWIMSVNSWRPFTVLLLDFTTLTTFAWLSSVKLTVKDCLSLSLLLSHTQCRWQLFFLFRLITVFTGVCVKKPTDRLRFQPNCSKRKLAFFNALCMIYLVLLALLQYEMKWQTHEMQELLSYRVLRRGWMKVFPFYLGD